jgi:O-succinylbenzoate synthase
MRSCIELEQTIGPIAIEEANLYHVAVPMREPFRISSGEVGTKEAILVRLRGKNSFGWGESSAMPGAFYSAETPQSCRTELVERVIPGVIGRQFDSLHQLESELDSLTSNRFVRVAIETAAWEMVARQRGQSIRQLMGFDDRAIPSGLAVGLYDTAEALQDALRRYNPLAYHRLKLKIKRGADIEVVAAARSFAGDFPMFVDANADYSSEDIPVFQQLDRFGLMMFEQPMGKDELDASAQLQSRVTTSVCHDESAESVDAVLRALALRSCRIVNIKLQRVGGYLEALRIIEVCQQHGIPVWMGTMPELGVGSAQALVLAAHPACRFPTDVEPSLRWYVDDILREPLVLQNRFLHLPAAPGIGFTVNRDKLERYALWSHRAVA